MASSDSEKSEKVAGYQLRFWLVDVQPIVWRRLLLRADNTLADLHNAIQICCRWSDDFLHQFKIYGQTTGVPRIHGPWYTQSAADVQLSALQLKVNQRFLYEYNFFVNWQLEIRVEKVCLLEANRLYPLCIDGKRAAPPEDCGGTVHFNELRSHFSLFYIADQLLEFYHLYQRRAELTEDERYKLEDRQRMLGRLGYWAHVDKFERRPVNKRLGQYATSNESWRLVEGVTW